MDAVGPRISRRGALLLGGAAALAGCRDAADGPAGGAPATRAAADVRARDWSWLRGQVDGRLARPGDPSYDAVRRVQNPVYDAARPLAVLSVASTADVATGIAFARDHDLGVAIRSGGHSYPGWSAGDDRLVIDVRPLGGVRLAADGVTATVGAGAPLARVYDRLSSADRGLAAGSCATVGVAGLTLGGGQGIVARAHGLTCDAVTRMRVVTAAGKVVTASADERPGLFWALRGGGGGHLGVVTSFTFDTFAAPVTSTAYLQWPLDAADEVLPAWEAWAPVADRRLWSTLKGLGGERHPDGPVLSLSVVWVGPDDGLTRRLAAFLRDVPAPSYSSRKRRAFLDVVRAYSGCIGVPVDRCTTDPGGALQRERFAATSHVAYTRLPSAGVATFADRVQRAQGSGLIEAGIALDSLGGAVAEVAPEDTAFVHREALAMVQYTATHHAGDRAKALGYVRAARAAMVPSWGNHAYVNYADASLENYRRAYFGANAARLTSLRQAWDPDGFFTQPQEV